MPDTDYKKIVNYDLLYHPVSAGSKWPMTVSHKNWTEFSLRLQRIVLLLVELPALKALIAFRSCNKYLSGLMKNDHRSGRLFPQAGVEEYQLNH
jgi:hypothetical protein